MTIYIFTGPSLPPKDAQAELDAVYLPPVSQGDVHRVALKRPAAIGIIDGYFESVPSVWHKEVLWAMARGIHVFGAASMGALRAAELDAFGMEGVGAIYEAFRDGYLEDDDEVAVSHGPMEVGYPVLCEAMVNIRRSRVEDWRASLRVRWLFRRFRSGPQSGSHGHVSSPRSSNRTCGFPASGFRTRSCLRARKAQCVPRQTGEAVFFV